MYAKHRQELFTPILRNFHLTHTRPFTVELEEGVGRRSSRMEGDVPDHLFHHSHLRPHHTEDSDVKTPLVTNLLQRCPVRSLHFNVSSPDVLAIDQRYLGLNWVKENCWSPNCTGVVYFGDDDNKYDLRIFNEIRNTKTISVFNVGFAGGLTVEGPYCKNGKAVRWRASWAPKRPFPLDMAGFAVNASLFETHRDVWVGKELNGDHIKIGYMETRLLEMLGATRSSVECRSNDEEVLTWHIRTNRPKLMHNAPTQEV
ncbi:hypothetical protein EMCRGX_G026787 [Ephydatia muelleri]